LVNRNEIIASNLISSKLITVSNPLSLNRSQMDIPITGIIKDNKQLVAECVAKHKIVHKMNNKLFINLDNLLGF